ncbi:MAG: hypothetical protein WC505_04295 [Patescibacteria group bacterium]
MGEEATGGGTDRTGQEEKIGALPEDILKPEEGKHAIEKPKQRHRLRTTLIVLAIIIAGVAIAAAATGVYAVPGVSALLGTDSPRDLGVQASSEGLASTLEKTPWTLEGDPADYTIFNRKEFIGSVNIDHQLTSEELTSFLNEYLQNDPYVSNVQVKMVEGGIEASGMVKKYVNAPVYVRAGITKVSEKSIDLTLEKAEIGRLPVSEKYLQMAEDYLEDLVNSRMAQNPGFSIKTLEYHDGYDVFEGTVPETVRVTGGSDWWNGL